jgi:DMSO/TMAO reductase YedYZ molybdopterin-dependent catalytic subunit
VADRRAAVAGVVAVVLAVGVAELLAGLLVAVPSPLDAVGRWVVPAVPGPLTSWVIATFGTANRLVLLLGTVLVAAGIGAALGLAARRSPLVPALAFGAAGVLGALAAAGEPGASAVGAWATIAVAVGVGWWTLGALTRRASASSSRAAPSGAPAPPATAPPAPARPAPSRRDFLRAAAGLGTVAVVTLATGRLALGRRGELVDPSAIALPPPARALPAVAPAQRFTTPEGLSPLLTPTDRFFRIDTALRVPQVDPDTWELTVEGLVERELRFRYDDLLAMPLEEVDVTLLCVSNEVGGDLVGTARWTGVRLADLLERAGIAPGAEQVLGRSVDGFTAGFPLEAALDGRDALVAVGMDGAPLPTRHGFPARLVVPGLYGYVSATKWLASIELTPWDGVDGYWIPRGWAKRAPVKTASRIDVPTPGSRLPAGPTVVAGVAWAPTRGIERVEVRVDDGPWVAAELAAPLSADTWVQWRAEVELPAGERALQVRAVDGTGAVQPVGPRPPAPDGAEGWHRITVRAA